jgi:hypothetical protein
MDSQRAYYANAARIDDLVRTAAAHNPSLPVDGRVLLGSRLRSLVTRRGLPRLRPRIAC